MSQCVLCAWHAAGVILVRLIEIASKQGDFSLSERLRVPAISRTQKIFNVNCGLEHCIAAGAARCAAPAFGAGTRRTPPTSAPGLGSPPPTSAPGLGPPLPHLRRDWAAQQSRGCATFADALYGSG